MSSEKSYRNTRGDDFKGRHGKDAITKELASLFRSGANDYTALQKLRYKYKDSDMIDAIFDAYKERQEHILKKVRKFKQLIYDRYAPLGLSFEEMLKKAKKYQKKYKLTDDEFHYFVTLSLSDKGSMSQYHFPNTALAKTLGYDAILATSDKLRVKDAELSMVQEILRLYGETKSLHAQVVLQSLTYRDCAPEALVGKYDPARHNPYSYIHPIVAALFLPRVRLLDEHMLIANLGYIVQSKHEGRPVMTKPDFEVYWDLITDPNEHACARPEDDSPIKDLRNRFLLQTKLWESVLNFRQGKYYSDTPNDFLMAIENCKSNIYDSPDLTYVKDEGTIMRRLLAAFAIRPTIVTTTRLYNILGESFGLATPANPLSASGISQITTVPMVTLRLPLDIGIGRQQTPVNLKESLSQPQWFVENKMIVPKSQAIMHSRDVLFFYVGRRYKQINIAKMSTPYNFTHLPMTVAGFEKMNDRPVYYEKELRILNEKYTLRSVVLVERSRANKNLIVGSSAIVVIPRNIRQGRFKEDFLLYDPQGSSEQFRRPDGSYKSTSPITYIPDEPRYVTGDNVESFWECASTRGTIFMYQKDTSDGESPFLTF
jgi:hypothetical protein